VEDGQTLIEIWSGVASAARAIVTRPRRVPHVAVACTRKTSRNQAIRNRGN